MERALLGYLSHATVEAVLDIAVKRAGLRGRAVGSGAQASRFYALVQRGVALYCSDGATRERCLSDVRRLLGQPGAEAPEPVTVSIEAEADVVRARGQARTVAGQLGFPHTEQVKIATAVSELARNIHRYAGRGTIHITPENGGRPALAIRAEDGGPGIPNLQEILEGGYRSRTGMGLGLLGCKRLMDEFAVESQPGRGTRVTVRKHLAR